MDAIESTRAAVDGIASARAAAAAAPSAGGDGSDPGFRMFVGGTTYLYYEQARICIYIYMRICKNIV